MLKFVGGPIWRANLESHFWRAQFWRAKFWAANFGGVFLESPILGSQFGEPILGPPKFESQFWRANFVPDPN